MFLGAFSKKVQKKHMFLGAFSKKAQSAKN
jgi:hypothetical protein